MSVVYICRSGEEKRRRLQAQLEDLQERLNATTTDKVALETVKLDQDIKVVEAAVVEMVFM